MKSILFIFILFCGLNLQASEEKKCDLLYNEYGKLRSVLDWTKEQLKGTEKVDFLQSDNYGQLISSIAIYQALIGSSNCAVSTTDKANKLISENSELNTKLSKAIQAALYNSGRQLRNLSVNQGSVLEEIPIDIAVKKEQKESIEKIALEDNKKSTEL